MSLFSLFLSLLALLMLLLAVTVGYMQLYKRNINRVLVTKNPARHTMPPPHKVFLSLLVVLITALLAYMAAALFLSNPIVSARDVETNARSRAQNEGMSVKIAITDDFAAVLYYEEDGSDHSFEIYENQGKLQANYVFTHGGSSSSIQSGVRMFRYEEGVILLSMNEPGITDIVCHDGESYQFPVDSPFILILPSSNLSFYDRDGNLLNVGQDLWYEVTEKE